MSTITKTWLAFAGIGTGLIHLALVIGAPLPAGIVLALIGAIEFGWGVFTFAGEKVAAPRVVLAGALVPLLLWGLLIATGVIFKNAELAATLGFFPLSIATLFELFVAGVLAVHLRREADAARTPRVAGVGKYLLGVLVGGLAVAALTTPALAATQAGLGAAAHTEETGNPAFQLPEHPGH